MTESKMIPKIKADSLLFIGDPHQSSRTPGRRTDECFYQTVANKISQAMKIAEERNAIPVFLGDFFDREDDTDASMLVSTINALKTKGHKPWTLVGNHEKKRTVLTDDTALGILISADFILRFPDNGLAFILEAPSIGGGIHEVAVGGTAYDQIVPSDVRPFLPKENMETVWLTHHDWTFKGGYQNTTTPYNIDGCSLVVNGHIHMEKPSVKAGGTMYVNPGNITRMSIDLHNHVPRVWLYKPGNPRLFPIALEFKKDVFDWTGKIAHPIFDKTTDEIKSEFVSIMSQEVNSMENRTQDGVNFLHRMHDFCNSENIGQEVKDHLTDLFKRVVNDEKNEQKATK